MADRTLNTTKREKDMRYIVRRPNASLKDDHHSGNMDILSMYRAIDKLVMVGVVSKSRDTWERDANVQGIRTGKKKRYLSREQLTEED